MGELVLFVATSRAEVPEGVLRFASVDGSVPGATLVWDHHVTGEPVSLDAMPRRVDLSDFDGLGTTLADTDAIVGAAIAVLGGLDAIAPEDCAVLRSASFWCDHLRSAPGAAAEHDRLGRGLHEHCAQTLASVERSMSSGAFARLVRELVGALRSGGPLPHAEPRVDSGPDLRGLRRISEHGPVALVDLRGVGMPIDPLRAYAQHRCPVAVTVGDHSKGGLRYTVGVNPHVAETPSDLGRALTRLALAEHAHGPPCLLPTPGPGTENWGGRATVFGSPWNHGSRLAPEEVVAIVRRSLA
ncbi:MAG: hypothetical protein ACK6CU_18335 [Deltaproteobacteria bacterium]